MEITADNLFEPQAVLPVQFHAARAMSPERGLMLAVLEDALRIHGKWSAMRDSKRRRLVAETEAWLFSDDTTWPFSFVNVCGVLGIDPAWLRAHLGPQALETPMVESLPLAAAS